MSKEKSRLTKSDKIYFAGIGVFSLVMCIYYFAHEMSQYNTSLYALNYKYGFLSRGIVGTVWKWIDDILPFDLMHYEAIFYANIIFTAILYILIFVFAMYCISKLDGQNKRNVKYLVLFLMIFTVPTFVTRQNLGRIDIFLMMISIICVWLIIVEKAEWLIVPLCIIAMLIHQGFVFTNVNIILVLLLYKALTSEKKKKYVVIFIVTLIVVSGLFLYFEFAREYVSQENFDEMVNVAKSISPNGEYYEMLFKHELLGLDVYEDESFWHLQNRVETPIFVTLFLPYVLLAVKFFIKIFKGTTTKKQKWLYFFVVTGSLTLLPEWLLKVDFGRYVYMTVFYYVVIVIALICMGDEIISESIQDTKVYLWNLSPFTILLVVYPLLFMPLYDTEISRLTYNILRIIGFRE